MNGAYGEYIVLPGRFVHKLPDDMDLKRASLCEPMAVVLKGLKRLERAWGTGDKKNCAVVGAGPIGHLCARILELRGHRITVFDPNPVRRAYFDNSGIETRSSVDLRALVDYEVLVEATGDPEALHAVLHQSRAGASLLLLGLPYARREFSFENVVVYDKVIIGSVGSTAQELREAIALLPQLDLQQYTQKTFPLEEFEAAWEVCRSKSHLKAI